MDEDPDQTSPEIRPVIAPWTALVVPALLTEGAQYHVETKAPLTDNCWTNRVIHTLVRDGLLIPVQLQSCGGKEDEWFAGPKAIGLLFNADGQGDCYDEWRTYSQQSLQVNDEDGHYCGRNYEVSRA